MATSGKASGYCYISNDILKNGRRVGFMYREFPESPADSGWRFISAQEPEEYFEDQHNVSVRDIDEIPAIDPAVVEHLGAPSPAQFIRDEETHAFIDMQPRKSASQKALTVAFVVCFLAVVNYAVLACIVRLPPYSWLAHLQERVFRGPMPLLTGVATVLLMLAVVLGLAMLAARVVSKRLAKKGIPWVFEKVSSPEMLIVTGSPRAGEDPKLAQVRLAMVLVIVVHGLLWGGGFVVYGARHLAQAPPSPGLVHLSAADIYGATRPSAEYVSISGRLDWHYQVAWPQRAEGTRASGVYVPLVPDAWTSEEPVTLLVEMPRHRVSVAEKQTASEGLLKRDSVPVEVHRKLTDMGITLADDALVLNWGVRPSWPGSKGWFRIIFGGILAVASLLVGTSWLVKHQRARRSSARSPALTPPPIAPR